MVEIDLLAYRPSFTFGTMQNIERIVSDKRFCLCGCGLEVSGWNTRLKKPVEFIHGHNGVGVKNCNWKGDNVGKKPLHNWVRSHLPQPEFCQICNVKPPVDLANITKIYTRDFSNWRYLCRSCHLVFDNAMGYRWPWNRGKTGIYSDETRRQIGEASKGRKTSEETKMKISKALTGRKYNTAKKRKTS